MVDADKEIFDARTAEIIEEQYLPNAANYKEVLRHFDTFTKTIEQVPGTAIKSPYLQNQFEQPATAHYYDHFFDVWTHPGDGLPYNVELARFDVQVNAIGIVRKINQWVSGNYTRSDNWGNPVTGAAPDAYLWSLRLCNLPVAGGRVADQNPLPGRPYPDLPQWQYLWFFPHAAGSDLNLVIPGGYSLRFFVSVPASQDRDDVMGRIIGFWQSSEYSPEAGFNARKGF